MGANTIATRTEAEAGARIALPLFRLRDERLARLVATGNERAFTLLYERYHQPLYRYCRSILGHDADAHDALQSTFAAAFGALRAGRRDAPLRPWLFRIAHNEAISMLRRRRPQDELAETMASPAPSPEEQAAERERLGQLVADLRELPERQRGALVMRELSGFPHEDIACAFQISVGAAKQTVFEARRSLTELAEGRAMECDDVQRNISDGDGRALRGRRMRAHLRSCSGCSAFAASIRTRRVDLNAISPTLPAAAAAGVFARIAGVGSVHGSRASSVTAGITGKTAGIAVSAKAITAGVAVLAVTAVGAADLHQIAARGPSAHAGPTPAPRHGSGAGAAGGPGRSVPPVIRRAGAGLPAGSWRVRHPSLRRAAVPGRPAATVAAGHWSGAIRGLRQDASSPGRSTSQTAAARGAGVHGVTGGSSGASRGRAPRMEALHPTRGSAPAARRATPMGRAPSPQNGRSAAGAGVVAPSGAAPADAPAAKYTSPPLPPPGVVATGSAPQPAGHGAGSQRSVPPPAANSV